MDENFTQPQLYVGGIYIHHAHRDRYVILSCDGQNSNNGQDQAEVVEYLSVEHGARQGKKRIRNVDEWNEFVKWPDGVLRPRFTYEKDIDEPEQLRRERDAAKLELRQLTWALAAAVGAASDGHNGLRLLELLFVRNMRASGVVWDDVIRAVMQLPTK